MTQQYTEVTLPSELVRAAIEALVHLYAVHAEALGQTAVDYVEGRATIGEVREARGTLDELDAALDDLGWQLAPRDAAVELTGRPTLLRELLYAVLVEGAEGVSEACRDYEAARLDLAGLQRACETLLTRMTLFAAFERSDAV